MAAGNFFSCLGGREVGYWPESSENCYPSRWPTDDAAYYIVAVTFALNGGFFAGKLADPQKVGMLSYIFAQKQAYFQRHVKYRIVLGRRIRGSHSPYLGYLH